MTTADMSVRPYATRDLAVLHMMNNAAVPNVNALTKAELVDLVETSLMTRVVVDGDDRPVGFVLCLNEGLAYDSLNYAWVSARYDSFAYVDRVVVADDARGRGVGRVLYDATFMELGQRRDQLLLEVNLEPPNPVSRAFHIAMGFDEVGERWTEDRAKGVVYMRRPLHA